MNDVPDNDRDYNQIKNFIIVSLMIIISLSEISEQYRRVDPRYFFKYNRSYIGGWQNIKKDMNNDILHLEKCLTYCKIIFYDNGEVYTENKGYWSYRTIRTNVWYRTAVKYRIYPAIKDNGISELAISETLTLADDGKTLTSVVGYYDKVNKKWVQLGEKYIYRKIE